MSITKKFVLAYFILLIIGTFIFEMWDDSYRLIPDLATLFLLTILFFTVIYLFIIKPTSTKLGRLSKEIYELSDNDELDLPTFSEPELQEVANAVNSAAHILRQQKNMLDWILDHIPAGIVIYQPTIIYANKYAVEHLNLNIDNISKLKPVDFLAKEVDSKKREELYLLMLNRIKGVNGRKSYNTELYVNGKKLQVFAVSDTIEYNDKPAGIITFIDITELKWAELELTLIQRYLPMVAYHIFIDNDGEKFYYISNAIEELTGFKPDEIKSQPNWWYRHIHPEDKDSIIVLKEQFSKNSKFKQQYRLIKKDGTYIWIDEQIVMLEDRDGRRELVGFWRDITREKIWQFAHNALASANECMLKAKNEEVLFEYLCKVLVERGFCRYAWIGRVDIEQDRVVPIRYYPKDDTYACEACSNRRL